MPLEMLYQRWLEIDVPAEAGGDRAVPMWTWPLPLSDGRALVTLLYRPLPAGGMAGGARVGPRTVIVELSPSGDASAWGPGAGYPAPVLFYGTAEDELVGFDLVKKGKVYACRPDGTHLWTLETKLKMGSLIAPDLFRVDGGRVLFKREDGEVLQGRVDGGTVQDLQRATDDGHPPLEEIHFPHTHVTRDGTLWVFEFDPMPRVTRLQMPR
jgi:hypothetical protein